MEVFDVVKIGSKNTVALVNCGLNVTEGGIRPTFHSAALKRSLFLTLHLAKADLVEQVSQPGTHVFFPPTLSVLTRRLRAAHRKTVGTQVAVQNAIMRLDMEVLCFFPLLQIHRMTCFPNGLSIIVRLHLIIQIFCLSNLKEAVFFEI